jgi:hypothetical protein
MRFPISRPVVRLAPQPARGRLALLGFLMLLVLTSPLPAQQRPSPAFLAGTHVFRRILLDMKMTALTSFEQMMQAPQSSILIVHGNPRSGKDLHDWTSISLVEFLDKGGAVLFASDEVVKQPALHRDLVRLTGYEITGRTILNNNPEHHYLSAQCPLLRPHPNANPNLFAGAGGQGGLSRVATNRPSHLRPASETLRAPTLAYLPPGCYDEDEPILDDWQKPSAKDYVFAVRGDMRIGKGRLLLLADHSLFINAMMMQGDNQNVEFTINCLDYLRETGGPRRDKVLFLEEGKINSNFNIPLKDMPGLSDKAIRTILALLDGPEGVLARLEDHDAYNRAIVEVMAKHNITRGRIEYAVIIALSLLLLCYVCLRLLRTRGYRPDPGIPLTATAVEGLSDKPLLEQRQRELLWKNNVWENARRVARQAFLSAGVQPGADPRRPPSIKVQGGWWSRWTRSTRIRWLWRLAFDPRPVRVRTGDWSALMNEFEQLRADLASGIVQVGKAA